MKVLTQNFKNGALRVEDYPMPACPANGALVATTFSAVSLGTERAVYHLAKASPLEKARKRPDLVRQVWNRAKNDGLLNTLGVVRNLISSPVPLGYSCCGIVLEKGYRCEGIEPGDRVACAGFEFANHAEVNAVPGTMLVKIPEGVADEEACYATVASVALQALRLCDIKVGDTVLILGLGLLGHLAAALADLQGAVVLGQDPDGEQVLSARKYCPRGHFLVSPMALRHYAETHQGLGADHTLVCASGGGEELFRLAGELTRDRGEVVVVGDVRCTLPRRVYYQKELQVKFSRAYGPGRYDTTYEQEGRDYPYGYVRWTMQRNMGEILRLAASRQLNLAALTTHRFPIADADTSLRPLFENHGARAMGIVLEYPGCTREQDRPIPLAAPRNKSESSDLRVGLIGAGRFAQGILLPAFKRAGINVFTRIATERGLSAVNAGRKIGATEAVSRADDVIGDGSTNAVIITTRHGVHADLICAALAAGKHVFCEKPLCLNEAELQRIEAAEREAAGILMVGFNRRFSPLITDLRDYMNFATEPAMLLYRVNAGAQPPDHWVHDEHDGGGRIIGECCHYFDVAQILIGAAPVSVHAVSLTGANAARTSYDSASMTVKYADGSTAVILFAANGDTSFPKEYLEIHRADSSAFLQNYRTLAGRGPQGRITRRSFSQQKGFVEEAIAFRQGCASGKSPTPIAELSTVTRLTFAAMESLRTGEPVSLAVPESA